MNICGHIISKSQVIGIGPLMLRHSPDQTQQALYNSTQLFFWLHLKNHSAKIESDWFQLGFRRDDLNDFNKQQRDLFNQFKGQYDTAKAAILEAIDEVVIN